MFISNLEKSFINRKIATLTEELADTRKALLNLDQTVTALLREKNKPKKAKKPLSPEQKAKQAEYMRRYTARKKAEKAAKLAQVIA